MASTLEPQEQDHSHCACTSHNADVSSNTHVNPSCSSRAEDEYHALATHTANLDLKDQDTHLVLSSKDADDTWSDEEAPSETVDENSEPQPAHVTATAPANDVQEDRSKSTEDVKDADAAAATTSKDANPEPSQDDETNTPRFQTYIKLHNDVSLASNPPPSHKDLR